MPPIWEVRRLSGIAPRPNTVIVKLPSPHAKNRRLCKRLGLHKGEYDFYRLVARRGPGAVAGTALR